MAITTMEVGDSAARRRHRAPWQPSAALLALGATLAALLLVSGCGAGRNAATSHEETAVPGVDADAGPIALRNLLIPFREGGYPAGSDVPLVVRVFSTAEQPVQVSQIAPGANGMTTVQAQRIALRQPAAGNDGPPTSLVVPAEGDLLLVPGSGPYLVAEHITAALPYTASVPVRFSFSTGDSVQVDVPMAPPTYPVTGGPGSQVGPSPPPTTPSSS